MRTKRQSRARGFVLVLVLGLLLLLGILASVLATISLADSSSFAGAGLQTQATTWSIMGVQDALARLRTGNFDWIDLPLCSSAETCPMSPPPFHVTDPQNRYDVTIFKRGRDPLASKGNGTAVVVLSSRGNSLTNGSYSSVLEVEVQMPQGNKDKNPDGTGNDF